MLDSKEILELAKKYNNNMSKIAQVTGCCRTSISNYFYKYNIKRNLPGSKRKYLANDFFFSKWSVDMAYCLGFIAADGHVWKERPFLTICISNKDHECLDYIKNCISPNTKIRNGQHNTIQICINSKRIWKDLNKYGINHNKSEYMRLPKIPNKFLGDFLRGYFDGDGSIWESVDNRRTKTRHNSSLASSCEIFLLDIWKVIKIGRIRKHSSKKCYYLEFSQNDTLKLKDILYKDCHTFKMIRKYEKFLNIVHIPNNIWTKKEISLLKKNIDKKISVLEQLLPSRTRTAIQTRKQRINNAIRTNNKN